MCIWCSLVADDLETHWEVFEASLDDDDDTIAGDNISSMTRWHHETMTRLTGTMLEIQVWRCGSRWMMTGWMEDAPQFSHNSIISTFTNISQGGWWVRGAGPLITSQHPWLQPGHSGDPLFRSGSEECLLEAWTLASLACKEVSYPYHTFSCSIHSTWGSKEKLRIKHCGMH